MSQEEYIKSLENTIESLQNQVNNLTEMVKLLTKKQFGRSSEKTKSEIEHEDLRKKLFWKIVFQNSFF